MKHNGRCDSRGAEHALDEAGTSIAIGQWIQGICVLTALIAGAIATRANYRKPAPAWD